jgi:hypothetical protein
MHASARFASVCLLAGVVGAQAFHIPSNTPTTGTCNVIPFGTTASSAQWVNQIYQTVVTDADLGSPTAPLALVDLAFANCGTQVRTFSRLKITMAQLPGGTLGASFAANLVNNVQVVFDAKNFVWNTEANLWSDIGLQSAYGYQPGQGDLVIEVLALGNDLQSGSGSGFHRDIRPRLFANTFTGTPPATGTLATGALKMRLCAGAALPFVGVQYYGTASPTNAGTPAIGPTGLPVLGNAGFAVQGSGLVPGRTSFLLLGFPNNPPIPLGSIGAPPTSTLLVSPLDTLTLPTSASGTATAGLPVPPTPALQGAQLSAQMFDLDFTLPFGIPLGNSDGMTMSLGACADVGTPQRIPLAGSLLTAVRGSALTSSFSAGMSARGWSLDFANPLAEEHLITFTDSCGIPANARFAMVPAVDATGVVQAFYFYSSDGVSEGADLVRPFGPELHPTQDVIRIFTTPDLASGFDLTFDFTRFDGCNPGITATAFGAEASYLSCVVGKVINLLRSAKKFGILAACKAACSAGGLSNSGCVVCVVAAGVSVGWIWWKCK